MAFTYDVATERGQVRLLISDTDTATAANQVFTDAEIDAFLALEGANVRRAAAQALDTIASNEALVQKVLRTVDITTDGAKLADALHKHAEMLRGQADDDATLDDGGLEIAELVVDPFSYRQRLTNELLRGA